MPNGDLTYVRKGGWLNCFPFTLVSYIHPFVYTLQQALTPLPVWVALTPLPVWVAG